VQSILVKFVFIFHLIITHSTITEKKIDPQFMERNYYKRED
jgi:hypothetical protein